jgi:hypothetical protein
MLAAWALYEFESDSNNPVILESIILVSEMYIFFHVY